MGKVNGKVFTEYCITGKSVLDILKQIPNTVEIKKLYFRIAQLPQRTKTIVSDKMKKIGVGSVAIHAGVCLDIRGCLSGTIPVIRKNLKSIVEDYGVDIKKANVTSLYLEYKGIEAFFTNGKKGIVDKKDKRKRVDVLKMTEEASGNILPLIDAISMDKYSCQYDITPKRTIICTTVNNPKYFS